MKNLIIIAFLFYCCNLYAQTIKQYKAKNGVTYHVGDTVRLGRGSNENGSFLYIEDRGLGLPTPPGRSGGHYLPKEYANSGVVIKSISKFSMNGIDKYQFMVNAGGLIRFAMFIDDAIAACEVKPCGTDNPKQVTSVADEIKKLKTLLDQGAITKTEYEDQKKKLLGE